MPTVTFKKKNMPFGLDEVFNGDIDDFKSLVDPLWLKILIGILFLYTMTINNILTILMIQFEKFGGDSMKRSLHNQLLTQVGYSIILYNIICTPILTWRIIFTRLVKVKNCSLILFIISELIINSILATLDRSTLNC